MCKSSKVKVKLSIMVICYLIQILQYKIAMVGLTIFCCCKRRKIFFLIFVIQGRLKRGTENMGSQNFFNPCSKMRKATFDNGYSGSNKHLLHKLDCSWYIIKEITIYRQAKSKLGCWIWDHNVLHHNSCARLFMKMRLLT